ncbi:DMT family transporter [Geomonas sp. Red69]|uniref:DMT family transporter n=1 Tax=Geomonas diazotrophica TaxID=2843197 RepID=A0ABX8JW07_9BACT|nr:MULTISPECIES: DMT family transporter [Geomonas]MBU5637328.1 DMT family transporter [Geomonas diazotrophica]QWV99615.1 DMT family transporter [Geomonas nitrogeniifigens]
MSDTTSKPWINPYLAILVGVFAVSFSSILVRVCTAPPLVIAAYRLIFTFCFLAPFTLWGGAPALRGMTARQVGLSAASGVFLALHFVTWFISLKYTSIASSVVLVTTQPLFVVLGSWIFFKERVPRKALYGCFLAFVGSVVIGATDFQVGRQAFIGDLLALFAAVMVSGYLLIGRRLRHGVPLTGYTFVTYGASSLTLTAAAAIGGVPFYPYPAQDWLIFVALALVCTILGHTVFNWVLRYVQASVVSVSILGEPLGAILWAAVFLGENPTPRQALGGAIIFAGLFLFTRVTAKSDKPAESSPRPSGEGQG